MYGPRCVVGLLLVVPSSDWFWCGQVKMFRESAFQGDHSSASCTLVMAPHAKPRRIRSVVRVPLRWHIDSCSSFATARRFALPFRGGASIHVHLFTAALLQPLKFTSGLAFPGQDGIGRIDVGTAICFSLVSPVSISRGADFCRVAASISSGQTQRWGGGLGGGSGRYGLRCVIGFMGGAIF